ncbi:NAD(P)-binding protein [Sandaracinus amylolyticus]|uniref:NAD(P)-binding protein n=1 Tax=Sandaracinus amylolyticus TaxID=927083 RepID=UPI001F315DD5|nr:NAD(P)-binding protein [Sandaracinus amylolyticus]UJR84670.1 Hypothetical protein I5071_67490 [Sandaracinus amylolyticus]
MPGQITYDELCKRARATVDSVADDPQARLALRQRYYERWGGEPSPYGLGRSELDFMGWEIERGVLDPIAKGGSPWWRAVNAALLYHAELASLIAENLPELEPGSAPVRFWLAFQRDKTPQSWYRAHNSSIVAGYLESTALAHAEPWSERVFMNIVLYRLLYAQSMVEGAVFGDLGKILANPALPSVEIMVEIPAFYPRHYPLTRRDVRNILQKGHSLGDDLEKTFDDLFVIPELTALYEHASGWIGQPGLKRLINMGLPDYPGGAPADEQPVPLPPPRPGAKRKVAILGGGLASLSAAYELTSYPNWRDHYEVTLYQIGWRVGGKTANGFGPADRIEERGIHIFQGWYNNAFRMVRDAYDEMAKYHLAPGSPLPKWTDAFVPDDATLFTQQDPKTGEWTNWPILFPYNDELPGEGGPPPIYEVIGEALGLLAELVLGSPYAENQSWIQKLLSPIVIHTWFTPPWEKSEPHWWKDVAKSALGISSHEKPELQWVAYARDLAEGFAKKPTVEINGLEVSVLRVIAALLGGFVTLLRHLAPSDRTTDDRLEHIYVLAEYGLANLRGFIEDVYDERTHQLDFGRINDRDYREWLLSHGLPTDLRDCAPVRFIYCGCFHNMYQGEPGRLAADLGLRSLLASVTYRGSLVWKLVAGTGGSLTAPLYKMLAHRGVEFAFFRDVEEVHWSPTDEIESITVGVQVDLAPGVQRYSPLKKVKDVDGWPSHPHYDQLDPEQVRRMREKNVDLESPWADWTPVRTEVLRRGVDFDDVIHGIPVRATESICAEIVKHSDAWKKMVRHVRTTPTLGVQLWLRPTLAELGMKMSEWGMDEGDEPNSVIYADLLYSWTDMGSVLTFEGWRPDEMPGELSYYCGTWDTGPLPPRSDHGFPERERARLVEYTRGWLDQNMGWFFPNAVKNGRFDLSLIVDPSDPSCTEKLAGETRLARQWFTVNAAPSEQYTLAWPGSDKYRLAADQSGFRNLFLCGDWTNFGLNIGHVEGAVTSGLVAAQAFLRLRMNQNDLREIYPDVGIPGAS